MFVAKRTRTSQPQVPVGIDWENPITAGLVLTDNPPTGFNEVDGRRPVSQVTKRVAVGGGVSYWSGSDPAFSHRYDYSPAPVGDTSLFMLVVPDEHDCILVGHEVGTSGIEYGIDSTGAFAVWASNGGAWEKDVFGLSGVALDTEHAIVACHDDTTGEMVFYIREGVYTATILSGIPSKTNICTSCYVTGTGELAAHNNTAVVLLLMWNRILSASEAHSIRENPWQVFSKETVLVASVVAVQYALPISDVSAGTWTASTGSDLFAMLDETVADDGDYITTTSASTCEVALGSLTDPALSTGHIVRYRISATGGGIIVRLREGSTTIASWTHDPAPASPTTYAQTLSGGEADSITDYGNLRYQFEAI